MTVGDDHRASRSRSTSIATGKAADAACPGTAAARRLAAIPREPLPARILRRTAAAHRHRARAGRRSEVHRRRRAGLRARRLDPGAGHQPAAGSAAEARADLPVHRTRPLRRPPHLEPRGGDVRRQDRRDRGPRPALRQPAAPVHAGAALGDPDSRSRRRAPPQAHHPQRRHPLAGEPAVGLPFPHALSDRVRALQASRCRPSTSTSRGTVPRATGSKSTAAKRRISPPARRS